MAFLKNAWYCAGWATDLANAPSRITIVGEDVLLFRDSAGTAKAVSNRCPHRFAPLSDGKIVGDNIECPYHGLQFNGQGVCVLNPHGQGLIPPRAQLTAYRVVEQHGALWIWMGDAEKADPSTILDLSFIVDHRYAVATGVVHINANYQLLNDNLLDLTHVGYIHVDTVGLPPDEMIGPENMIFEVKTEETAVESNYSFLDVPPTPQLGRFFKGGPRGNVFAFLRWQLPSSMLLDLSMSPLDQPKGSIDRPDQGDNVLLHPVAHLIVPETETTCHYFYAMSRNVDVDDAEGTQWMGDMGRYTFSQQDGKIAEACQALMGEADFYDLQPAILETDRAAIAARRIIAKYVAREQKAVQEASSRPNPSLSIANA